jgi:hypothetical protein
VVLLELAGCVDLSGAIGEELIDPAEINVEILRAGEPMIAQGIFDTGAEHIFCAGGGRRAGSEIIAGRGRIEIDRAGITVAAITDARRRIEEGAIESIAATRAQRAEIIGAAAGKTVGADAEWRIGGRSGECATATITKVVEVRFQARHERADLVAVARLEAACDAGVLAAAVRDEVEARRRKANRFKAGIDRSKPRAHIRPEINSCPGENWSRCSDLLGPH